MNTITVIEGIAAVLCVFSGIAAWVIWRIWPNNGKRHGLGVTVLKTAAAILFLGSGLLEFVMQLIGLFS